MPEMGDEVLVGYIKLGWFICIPGEGIGWNKKVLGKVGVIISLGFLVK